MSQLTIEDRWQEYVAKILQGSGTARDKAAFVAGASSALSLLIQDGIKTPEQFIESVMTNLTAAHIEIITKLEPETACELIDEELARADSTAD